MADPTNRNDPAFANNPNYVWSGGRWQAVNNPSTANNPGAAPTGTVKGESLGTPGGFSDVFEGLFSRLGGKPFGSLGGQPQGVISAVQLANAAAWQNLARQNATRQQAVNPYNAGIADQSRSAQLALIQQMRAQQAGPSLAALQGQRGMAQAGQQALMQGGRAGMLGAQGASTGMAGDIGQARLAEVMRSQAGMGGAAGNLRGADLRSAEAQAQAGIRAQGLNDQSSQFYSAFGARGQTAADRVKLENDKLNWRIAQKGRETNEREANNYMQLLASMFSMGMGGMGGGK